MLKTIVRAVNFKMTDPISQHINGKSIDLERFLKRFDTKAAELRVEVGLPSRHHRSGEIFYAEINLKLPGKLLRAEEKHFELSAALNTAFKDIETQVRKFRGKAIKQKPEKVSRL